MILTTDWHVHSHHSCECHQMGSTIADLIAAAAARGITDTGLTDHVHSRYNLPDLAASRLEFLASDPPARYHFGAEVTCMRRWELEQIDAGDYTEPPIYGRGQDGPLSEPAIALTQRDADILGIEYIIGGVHWARGIEPDPAAIVEFFHRQMLFLAQHPLVDIVAHPWWWHDHFTAADGSYVVAPWVDGFDGIPPRCHEEFAAALIAGGTAAELNPGWMLGEPFGAAGRQRYLDYLRMLKDCGVQFALGCDHHADPYTGVPAAAGEVMEALALTDGDLWRLPPRTESLGRPADELLDAMDIAPEHLWCSAG